MRRLLLSFAWIAEKIYVQWFESAGWWSSVKIGQPVCFAPGKFADRVRRTGVRHLAQCIDRDTVMFLDRFETILEAYRTGAMGYGAFIARRPA